MSGLQTTTDNRKGVISVDSIIKQIKESQQNVLKAFEEHNNLVNKSLEIIQQLKTETKVEVVKVKDPLEELKKINDTYKGRKLYGYLRCLIIYLIKDCLTLYESSKISTTFKEIFLNLFNECLQFTNDSDHLFFNGKSFKESILKVRDIRWLLLEMEKYPQFFQFTEDDLTIMKENGASRDNIYLVKKFLKKDGDYEDYYSEEEGGGIKLQYHMTGGQLNGEYKQFYKDGKIEFETKYTNGVQDNSWKAWYNNGQQFVEGKITGENIQWYKNGNIMNKYYRVNDKKEGEYKEWNENGILMINANHKDDELYGECDFYYPNGKIHIQMNCIGGNIKKKIYKLHGRYIEYKEDGTYLKECFYTEGKLINLRTYNTSGHLELKKSLINYDTYELSRYYECDGKLHDQVIMIGDKWNGEYKSWWHNGNKCIETTYKDDKIHGDYTYWNEDGTLREKKYYNEGMIELNNSNFYISPTNHLHCDIKDTIAVLFYSDKCCKDFLPKFKNFYNITNHIKYAMCDIEKYPEVFELNKKSAKPFTIVPSILIYNKGSPFVRYDGELDDKKVLEFIKDAHYKATFGSLSKDINNMINKV